MTRSWKRSSKQGVAFAKRIVGRPDHDRVGRRGARLDEVGRDDVTGRQLFVLDAASPDDFPPSLMVPSPYFVCLLAWDARGASIADIAAVAGRLLQAGCGFVCCWGPDCERVHDVFDDTDLELRPDGPWCLSSWHSQDPLSEAMWFALFCAKPADTVSDGYRAVVGVSLGSSEWAAEIRTAFSAPAEFSDRVLAAVVKRGR